MSQDTIEHNLDLVDPAREAQTQVSKECRASCADLSKTIESVKPKHKALSLEAVSPEDLRAIQETLSQITLGKLPDEYIQEISRFLGIEIPESMLQKITASMSLIYDSKSRGRGTGFYINPTTIITNKHVVMDGGPNPSLVAFNLQQENLEIKQVVTSPDNDLAIITVGKTNPNHLQFAHEEATQGSQVYSLGFGGEIHKETPFLNITSGLLNAPKDEGEINFDMPIFSGDSGSPVLNEKGEIVGIVSKQDSSGTQLEHIFGNTQFKAGRGETLQDMQSFAKETQTAFIQAHANKENINYDNDGLNAFLTVLRNQNIYTEVNWNLLYQMMEPLEESEITQYTERLKEILNPEKFKESPFGINQIEIGGHKKLEIKNGEASLGLRIDQIDQWENQLKLILEPVESNRLKQLSDTVQTLSLDLPLGNEAFQKMEILLANFAQPDILPALQALDIGTLDLNNSQFARSEYNFEYKIMSLDLNNPEEAKRALAQTKKQQKQYDKWNTQTEERLNTSGITLFNLYEEATTPERAAFRFETMENLDKFIKRYAKKLEKKGIVNLKIARATRFDPEKNQLALDANGDYKSWKKFIKSLN